MQLNDFKKVKEGNLFYYSYKDAGYEIVIEQTLHGFAVGLYRDKDKDLVFPKVVKKNIWLIMSEAEGLKEYINTNKRLSPQSETPKSKKKSILDYTKTKIGDDYVYEYEEDRWKVRIERYHDPIYGGWTLLVIQKDKHNPNMEYTQVEVQDIILDKAKELGTDLLDYYVTKLTKPLK